MPQLQLREGIIDELAERIRVARGLAPAELVLENARVVNALTGEIFPGDVAIHRGRIAGVGRYQGETRIDLEQAFLSPGLIDGHIHLESSLLTPAEFVRAALPFGTTAAVLDPHEIANVAGVLGIDYLLEASRELPFSFYFMAPSCVPASPLEDSGATLGPEAIAELLTRDRVLGLGEVMDFPAVLNDDREMLQKLAVSLGKVIDGHAPGLVGPELAAYVSAGIGSDHESTEAIEAREKLRAGMTLMIRQGSVARNMAALLPLANGAANERCLLVSDDLLPGDLIERRHLAGLLARAVSQGMDPVAALRLVTLNPANYFRLRDLGRITPGARADLVAFRDLESFQAELVVQSGRVVARGGQITAPIAPSAAIPDEIARSMRLPPLSEESFRIPAGKRRARVIGLIPEQLLTEERWIEPPVHEGFVQAAPGRDLAKVAVIERHRGGAKIGRGLASGFGLLRGALASSISHDAHNLVVVGVEDRDMLLAAREVGRMQGGLAAAAGGKLLGSVPLPIAGLVSEHPARQIARDLADLESRVRRLGTPPTHPFMALSFITLSVIPALKITAQGLVDPTAQRVVELFEG